MADLVFTRGAQSDIRKLPASVRQAVANTIARLGVEPRLVGAPLFGRLRGRWSARVGNYRIVYTIEDVASREKIVIRAVRHRGVVYRRRRGG